MRERDEKERGRCEDMIRNVETRTNFSPSLCSLFLSSSPLLSSPLLSSSPLLFSSLNSDAF